jgi:serine/threonine protein phosphatase PrpC
VARAHRFEELEVGQFSDPGLRRDNNEDWIGTFQHATQEVLARKGSLFLLADGMGGHQRGDQASKRAVDRIIRSYMNDLDSSYMNDLDTQVDASLRRAIQEANTHLYAHADSRGAKGRARWGTTVVAAVVRRDELWIANVGDSRAYLQRNGHLRQISEDHSWAADLHDAPEGEWIGSHLITRALGLKPTVEVDLFGPQRLRLGDRILLCSDGLTSPVPDGEINEILLRAPPQPAAEALVAAANRKGGPDNISVIVIQVSNSLGEPAQTTKPDLLERLGQPDTWLGWVNDLGELVPEEHERLRRLAPILAVALIALGLVLLVLLCALVSKQGPGPIQLPEPR